MKKISCILLTVLCLLCFSACGGENNSSIIDKDAEKKANILNPSKAESSEPDNSVIEILEETYAQQINHIYFNPKKYIGRQIKFSGYFGLTEQQGETFGYVYRVDTEHTHDDGESHEEEETVGFEIYWDKIYPDENDWIEVTGEVEYVMHNGLQYIRLNLSELEVLTRAAGN